MNASEASVPASFMRIYGALWTNLTSLRDESDISARNHLAKSAGNIQLASAFPVSWPHIDRFHELMRSASSWVRESR